MEDQADADERAYDEIDAKLTNVKGGIPTRPGGTEFVSPLELEVETIESVQPGGEAVGCHSIESLMRSSNAFVG